MTVIEWVLIGVCVVNLAFTLPVLSRGVTHHRGPGSADDLGWMTFDVLLHGAVIVAVARGRMDVAVVVVVIGFLAYLKTWEAFRRVSASLRESESQRPSKKPEETP